MVLHGETVVDAQELPGQSEHAIGPSFKLRALALDRHPQVEHGRASCRPGLLRLGPRNGTLADGEIAEQRVELVAAEIARSIRDHVCARAEAFASDYQSHLPAPFKVDADPPVVLSRLLTVVRRRPTSSTS